jgi:hypothetical protein
MNKTITLFSISTSLLLGTAIPLTTAHSAPIIATTTIETPDAKVKSPVLSFGIHETSISTIHPELAEQLKTKKAGSIKFWEAVSWCETNHKWNDGGYYAGGLGIAQSAWRGYGGWEFAKTPKKATKEEQIVVANRISFFGFQTRNTFRTLDDKANNKPFFRPAIGWRNSKNWGKNCVNWRTRKPNHLRFTEQGMIEWRESRGMAPTVQEAGLSGRVSSQGLKNDKRCPQWEKQLKAHGLVPVSKFSYIMWRESRCQEKVISKPNSNGTRDYGLLQINSSWRTVTRQVCGTKDMKVLTNAKCNLKVAKYLFDNGGFGHWSASSGRA